MGVKPVAAATAAPAADAKPMISAVLLEEKAIKEPGSGAVETQRADLADLEPEDDAKIIEAKVSLSLAIRAFRESASAPEDIQIGGQREYDAINKRLGDAIETNWEILDEEGCKNLGGQIAK